MKELMSSFEYDNFIIVIAIIAIVIVILLLILLNDNKKNKKQYLNEITKVQNLIDIKDTAKSVSNNEQTTTDELLEQSKEEQTTTDEVQNQPKEEQLEYNLENLKDEEIEYIDDLTMEESSLPKEDKPLNEEITELLEDIAPTSNNSQTENLSSSSTTKTNDVIYDEHEMTVEEAKQELKDITLKLLEDNDEPIGHTAFETEQEEMSVISYDELKNINWDSIDESNDNLLKDNGDEPITIEELYQKQQTEQEDQPKPVVDTSPLFEELTASPSIDKSYSDTNFETSKIISPVYGLLDDKNIEVYSKENYQSNMNTKDLENELKKTEEFLQELKDLKSTLN